MLSRASRKDHFDAGAFWLRYGLCLAQVLVIVAYFIPWERVYAQAPYPGGLLETMYSELTHNPTQLEALFNASLIVCFIAAIISFLLAMLVLTKKREHASVLRASSMLSSLAIVGPLFFLHWYLPWPIGTADLGHLWPLISEMAIGWYIALFSGLVAFVLALYLYYETCESPAIDSDPREHSRLESLGTPLSIAFVSIIAFGAAVTVVGFLHTWNSGSASTIMRQDVWSNNGFEVSPIMYMVPAAGIVSCTLLILNLLGKQTWSPVSLQVTHNLLVVTLALTLSWGAAFGEFRSIGVDMVIAGKLSLGWYLCVIGQSITLAALFLYHRRRFNEPEDQVTRHSMRASS